MDRPDDDGAPLSIALIHAADQGGGAEASTVSLQRALISLGHTVRLYVGAKRSDQENVFQISRFRCFPGVLRLAKVLEDALGWQYVYHPWFRRLDRVLSSDVDVVHLHSLWSGRYGFADVGGLPRLTRRYPALMTLRDMWMLTGHCACPAVGCDRWKTGCGSCPDLTVAPAIPVDGTAMNWRRKRRNIQRSNLHVTAVSGWLAREVAKSAIFDGKRISTVYNGVDEAVFYPRPRSEVRRRHGLPANAFIVLITGQSVEAHGQGGNVARALSLAAMSSSGVDLFVLVVGHSSEAARSEWPGDGLAVPFQTDPSALASLYCAANVVLVASTWETFGRIAAEAQMCGVPVVTFDTGGLPEVVSHEETGLVVAYGDSVALGVALKQLSDDPARRARFGAAAAARARRLFGNAVVAKQYVDLYRREIRNRGRTCVASRES